MYVGKDGENPNIRSEHIIILIGRKHASCLLFKNVPENKAIAYIAVKFSKCGIIRLKTPINIKAITNAICLFDIGFRLIFLVKRAQEYHKCSYFVQYSNFESFAPGMTMVDFVTCF